MKTCPKCKGKNADDAKFCGKCGHPLSPKSFKWLKLLGIAILSFIAIMIGYILSNPLNIEVGKEEVVFDAEGGEISIPIYTNADRWWRSYTTDFTNAWENGNSITIKCPKNTGNERNTIVTIFGCKELFGIKYARQYRYIKVKQKANKDIYGEILDLTMTYNVTRMSRYGDNRKGISLRVKYDIHNSKGKKLRCAIWFYNKDNKALISTTGYYKTTDGQVTVQKDIDNPQDGTNTVELFIPISEFPKAKGYYSSISLISGENQFGGKTFSNQTFEIY